MFYHAKALPFKKKISQLNKNWNISPTSEGTVGVQQSLEERDTNYYTYMSLVPLMPPPPILPYYAYKFNVKMFSNVYSITSQLHFLGLISLNGSSHGEVSICGWVRDRQCTLQLQFYLKSGKGCIVVYSTPGIVNIII